MRDQLVDRTELPLAFDTCLHMSGGVLRQELIEAKGKLVQGRHVGARYNREYRMTTKS